MIIDGHVRVGSSREAELTIDTLLATMDALGIDRTLIAPDEAAIAVDNRRGNEFTTTAARGSGGRLLAYAVANPWHGTAALAELDRAAEAGAVALAVDPTLQGFDLLDGLLDPLIEFAQDRRWPVYVRTGTPPTALPLPLALLARRFPQVTFLMGRSGATDFWIDAAPAMVHAPNLLGDTCYAPWDTVLSELARNGQIGTSRLMFSTDAPYTVPSAELKRVRDWPLPDIERDRVLGGNLARLLALSD